MPHYSSFNINKYLVIFPEFYFFANSVDKPEYVVETHDMVFNGSSIKVKVAGKNSWKKMEIEFIDEILLENSTYEKIHSNHCNNEKRVIKIEVLDKYNLIKETWECLGSSITSVNVTPIDGVLNKQKLVMEISPDMVIKQ